MLDIWRGVFGQQKSQSILLLWWLCWIFSFIVGAMVESNIILPNGIMTEAKVIVFLDSAAAVLLIGIIIAITKGQKN